MFELRLDAKQCICCGICEDVCDPRALRLRAWRSRTVEGRRLGLFALSSTRNVERAVVPMGAFPYLADPSRCDGCLDCVRQCPVSVLAIREAPARAAVVM